jgi:hypothetical protein
VPTFADGGVTRGQRGGSPTVVNLTFLDWRCPIYVYAYVEQIWKRRMVSSGMLRRVALVRTGVSEEPGSSFIRVTRIGELGTTQAATSNRRTYVGC